jgi:hypothetical protein
MRKGQQQEILPVQNKRVLGVYNTDQAHPSTLYSADCLGAGARFTRSDRNYSVTPTTFLGSVVLVQGSQLRMQMISHLAYTHSITRVACPPGNQTTSRRFNTAPCSVALAVPQAPGASDLNQLTRIWSRSQSGLISIHGRQTDEG